MHFIALLAQRLLTPTERFAIYPLFLVVMAGLFWYGMELFRAGRSRGEGQGRRTPGGKGPGPGLDPDMIKGVLLCLTAVAGFVGVVVMILFGKTLLPG